MYLHNAYYIAFICVPKFYSRFRSDIRAAIFGWKIEGWVCVRVLQDGFLLVASILFPPSCFCLGARRHLWAPIMGDHDSPLFGVYCVFNVLLCIIMYCALFIVECVSKSNHSFSTRHTFPGQLLKDPNGLICWIPLFSLCLEIGEKKVFFSK